MSTPELAPRPVPAAGGPASLRDAWLDFRDRCLASDRFRRWSARFPLTRGLARRRANALFDLVSGFVYSQVLFACVQLRLFDRLAEGPATLASLAAAAGLAEPRLQRLLDAAVALQLLQRRSADRYGLGPLGAPMVGNGPIAAMVEHHAVLYADLRDPVALLRHEQSAAALERYWAYVGDAEAQALSDARVAPYSAVMAASNALVADQLLDAYPMRRHRHLLDVGGGEAAFLVAAARRAPGLQLSLFDLPAVTQRARIRLGREGLADRAQVHGGDFTRDPLPRGADVATLLRVLHDHDDATVRVLLRAVHAALEPGGTVIVAEPMRETRGEAAMGDAYFGLYLLAMGSGRMRSPQEIASLLGEAGFRDPRPLRTALPLQASALTARRA